MSIASEIYNNAVAAPGEKTDMALLEDQAHELANRSQWGAAAKALLRVARVEPHNTERWLKIAQWQRQDHDVKAAAKTLRTALRLNTSSKVADNPTAKTGAKKASSGNSPKILQDLSPIANQAASIALWLALAETEMEAQVWAECIAACEELLKLAPQHHLGQEILATALLYNAQIDEAVEVMQGLLRLSPRDPLHRLKLATLLHLQGQLGNSLREFQRVVSAHPDAPFTQEAYETIETLDKMQIQQILARATEDYTFRLHLQRAFELTLEANDFYLSDSGRESLRHLLWDGSVDDLTVPLPVIH
ncbi:MAG: hypothetical protein JO316_22275 [Abitibacteriaceae bacterium]|nr:hypothetical protein [Abditibacteriaceae bacterium]MBV9868091.1 hypothetical protein [Abditibacteriaceae bacterium]